MFIHYNDVIDIANNLPHLPDPVNGHNFSKNIIKYVEEDEWNHYKAKVVWIKIHVHVVTIHVHVL